MNRGNWQVAIQYTRLQRVRHDLARAHTHTHTHSVDYNNSWLERLSHLCFPVELFLIYMSDSQSCPSLCDPMDCSLPGSFIHEFFRQEYWSGLPFPSGIFPIQGLNTGSLHCRQILYYLSHQGSLLLRDISKYKDGST